MQYLVLFGILAGAAAVPLYVAEDIQIPLTSKTTITKSSVSVNHGGHVVSSVPVVHSVPVIHSVPVVHSVPIHPVHVLHAEPRKTTITKTNLSINHGSTHVVHATPVLHAAPVHILHAEPKKTTVTNSHLSINHGDTHVVHSRPVLQTTSVLVHAAPVHHAESVHVVHASPTVGRIGDVAISHHSSTVHKTEPLSLISVHH